MKIVDFIAEENTETLFVKGSVIIPLLNMDDVTLLKQIFDEYHAEAPGGFYATTHSEDKSLRRELSKKIIGIVEEKIQAHFKNIQLLGGAFISKTPGEKGILPLHQDWNIVDENEARSYNLWIPLVDVNESNGAMRILDKSHRKLTTYRGPTFPPVMGQITKEVEKHMRSLDMRAGELLIYDHALWHSSPVNSSNELRLAIVIGAVPKDVEMKFYHQKNKDIIEEYNSHPNFFFENDPKDGPKGLTLHREIKHKSSFLNEREFTEIYLERNAVPEKKGWLTWFKRKKQVN